MPRINTSSYHEAKFNPGGLEAIVSATMLAIERARLDFDTIAFTGLSGTLVAAPLCVLLDKLPLAIRRKGESGHHGFDVEGPVDGYRAIWVDDMICSGRTAAFVQAAVKSTGGIIVAAFLYHSHHWINNQTYPIYSPTNESRLSWHVTEPKPGDDTADNENT